MCSLKESSVLDSNKRVLDTNVGYVAMLICMRLRERGIAKRSIVTEA